MRLVTAYEPALGSSGRWSLGTPFQGAKRACEARIYELSLSPSEAHEWL